MTWTKADENRIRELRELRRDLTAVELRELRELRRRETVEAFERRRKLGRT